MIDDSRVKSKRHPNNYSLELKIRMREWMHKLMAAIHEKETACVLDEVAEAIRCANEVALSADVTAEQVRAYGYLKHLSRTMHGEDKERELAIARELLADPETRRKEHLLINTHNDDGVDALVIASTDHPFSMGRGLHMYIMNEPRESDGAYGLFVPDYDDGVDAIFVCITETMSAERVIELVVHECVHAVDTWFQRAHIVACTETRAYYTDWLVGNAIARLGIFTPADSGECSDVGGVSTNG